MNFSLLVLQGGHAGLRAYLNQTDVFNFFLHLNSYQWFALSGLLFCIVFCLVFLFKMVKAGHPQDYAKALGKSREGVKYAFTGAMHPGRKESAFLHRPTYIAGLIYHAGTLLGFGVFMLLISGLSLQKNAGLALSIFFFITGLAGVAILVKRMMVLRLRQLSNPDDYIANIFVSLFQWLLAASLIEAHLQNALWLIGGILFIYIPLGKLRHCVFFFSARYHLGYFYGSRGVWPPKWMHDEK